MDASKDPYESPQLRNGWYGMKWQKKILMGLGFTGFGLFLLCSGSMTWSIYQEGVHTYESVEQCGIGDLPDNARHIRRYSPYPLGPSWGYSFSTDEESFRDWVTRKTNNSSLSFSPLAQCDTGIVYDPDETSDDVRRKEIGPNLHTQWTYTDQGIYYTYEFDTQRAYYWTHSR